MTDAERLASNLVAFREAMGLSQEEAAALADVKVDTLRKYEQGRRTPTTEMLKRLCDAYGHTMDDAFAEDPPTADPAKQRFVFFKVFGDDVPDAIRNRARKYAEKINREIAAAIREKKLRE